MMSIALGIALIVGCRGQTPAPAGSSGGGGPSSSAESPGAGQGLDAGLSRIISEAEVRFRPLNYEYDEDLLKMIDRVEAYLSGKMPGPAPRAMRRLDEQEELDHLSETIRRWKAKTGKDLRAEIDALKAEVASRKPGGPAYHPEFHKRFSLVFDDFIPIEVAELRERRNRYIHDRAKPLFDQFRQQDADAVHAQEAVLNQPPYNLPPPEASPAKP